MDININPIRRNLKFGLAKNKALTWNPMGLHVTQFYNTLSIFFPAGERFFISSVRNYRQEITDPELKEQISAFIGQEAFHTREHEEYNEALIQAGMPIEPLEGFVAGLLDVFKKSPRVVQLAGTVSLEHLTAVLGDMVLSNPEILEGCDANYKAIWQWHSIEETEHKAVCFDAYETLVGKGPGAYTLRVSTFILANAIFWSIVLPYVAIMINRSGGLTDVKGWLKLASFTFGKPGVLRKSLPDWLSFFRPGFHPWDQDNREYLELADTLVEQVRNFPINQLKVA